jgi:hypothetical protein
MALANTINSAKNMQKFIGRPLLLTAVRAIKANIPGFANQRHWHKGRMSMHQNVIKELFGKVLVQGCVLVNLFAGGEFTFCWFGTLLMFIFHDHHFF